MHIPDGFLDTRTILATTALSAAGAGVALRHVTTNVPPRRIPLLGLASAFVFAAQMLNFPVLGGTSGHLLGSVLVAVLLGPAAAVLVMTTVVVVQCLLFADGGLLAMGANVFNMAIMATFTGYVAFRVVKGLVNGTAGLLAGVAFGSWISTLVAAVCCSGELAWSGTVGWDSVFPAMANIHMIIGIGEGVISALVVSAVLRTRPELVTGTPDSLQSPSRRLWLVYALLCTAGLVLFVSPFASTWPDGLDSVARSLGFDHREVTTLSSAPLAGYRIPGFASPVAATAAAGLVGTAVVFGLSLLFARVLAARIAFPPPGRRD
jgi:cobalt/nickel transport system permease protein